MAVSWAEAGGPERSHQRFPLIIELKSYAEARRNGSEIRDFLDFLCRSSGLFWRFSEENLKKRLTAGNVAVYLDGLDEILDTKLYEEIGTSIVRLANEFPKIQIVVTSRISGYREVGLRRAGFKHFILKDFHDLQIMRFIGNWYREIHPKDNEKDVEKWAENFRSIIFRSDTLHELASSPFFLTIMLVLGRDERIPRSRAELLEHCSNMLLERWKVEEAMREDPDLAQDAMAVGVREKQIMLRHIVRRMTTDSDYPINIISAVELEASIAKSIRGVVRANPLTVARAIIKHLRERNGILRLDGIGYYAFIHPAFMEYYCAEDLRHRLIADQSIDENYLKQKFGDWTTRFHGWDEVICFFCGMVKPALAGLLLDHIYALGEKIGRGLENIVFIAKCIQDIKEREQLGGKLVARIKKALMISSSYKNSNLKPIGNPWNSGAAKAELCVELLASIFVGTDDVAKHLQTLVMTSEFGAVRQKAIEALAQGWSNRPETRVWLEATAMRSKFADVRANALIALANYWQDADTLELLKSKCSSKRDYEVHRTAIFEIGRGWNNSDVFQWLKRHFSSSNNELDKGDIVEVIGRHFNQNRAALPWLKEIARSDQDTFVRSAAIEQVAMLCQSQQDICSWLINLARSDKDELVRSSATISLFFYWSEMAPVQALFQHLAGNDQDPFVRFWALTGLDLRRRINDPKTLILLKQVVQYDPDLENRIIAFEVLTDRNWDHDRETMQMLKALAEEQPTLFRAGDFFG